MNTKTCTQCYQEFTPSSRHIKCPACRSLNQKKLCVCGNYMTKDAKTCLNCLDLSGSKNGNFKIGGVRHNKGYIMLLVPNHPRVAGKKNPYVFEHILVMEQLLGRYLLPNENVHHKNGQKDDNQPNNLELWAKTQPAGQRVEDLVAWATTILETYGTTPTSIND